MEFSVRTADGTVTWNGSYKVDKNGVLRILPEDEGKPLILLSPAYWRELNEPRPSDTGKSGD
jgi:hypothetical protein